MDNDIIIDVKVDVQKVAEQMSEATKRVNELKEAQKGLKAEMQQGGEAAAEAAKKYAANSAEIETNNRAIKASTAILQLETMDRIKDNATLDEQRQLLNAAQKAYAGLTDEQKQASGGAQALAARIKDLSDKVKAQESALGDNRRNVGNYAESIQQAASQMGGLGSGIVSVSGKMQQAKSIMTVIAAHPIIAVLGVLITLLMKIGERFKNNAAAMERLTGVFGAFSGVGTMVNKVIDKIADGLGWIGEKALALAEKLGILSDEMKEGSKIAKEDLAIQKAQREAALKTAEDQKKIAELRAQAADKNKYSASERIKLLKQANDLEEGISKRQYDLAKREYELQVQKNAQSKSSQEDLKKENDLRIAMINAETAYFEKQRSLNKALSAARAEQAADAKRATDEERKEAEERAKIAEEQAKTLAAQRDEMRRRSQSDLENAIEDLRKQQAEELKVIGLTDEEKLAIEKYYDEQVAKLQQQSLDEQLKDREDKEKEAADFIAQFREQSREDQYEAEKSQLETYYEQGLISTEEYEDAKAKIEERYRQDKMAAEMENAQNIMDAVSGLNDAISAIEDAQLERYKQGQDARKKALDKRLKAGEISEEEYNKSVQQLEEETDRKEKEMEREQAKREKALGILNAAINTAAAIMRIWAEVPKADFGVMTAVMTALAAATGAAQIAAIAAQPLPQFAGGGIVGGTSYTGDNVVSRLNSREMVLNTDQQTRLFDALNGGNDTGLGINYEALAAANAAQPAPVMVLKELHDFEDKVSTFDEIASI